MCAFNFEVIHYKTLLDFLNISSDSPEMLQPQTSHPYKIIGVTKVSKRNLFLSHIMRFAILQFSRPKYAFHPINPFLNAIVPVELVMNINS